MQTEYKLLDHGYVKYIGHYGSDEGVIESARMSTDKGFQGWDKDALLLEYLWKNQHSTPFESPDLTIEVQAPIMVFREWQRHRTQSFNELSARYTELPNLYYTPEPSRIKKQSASNKQGSGEPFTEKEAKDIQFSIAMEQLDIRDSYESMLESGVAREIARINCPVSQYSRMRAKANLLNWLKFLGLRLNPAAQWEIREYAKAVADIIKQLFPRTYELFEEYTLNGVHFSRKEIQIVRNLLKDVNLTGAIYPSFDTDKAAKEFHMKLVN